MLEGGRAWNRMCKCSLGISSHQDATERGGSPLGEARGTVQALDPKGTFSCSISLYLPGHPYCLRSWDTQASGTCKEPPPLGHGTGLLRGHNLPSAPVPDGFFFPGVLRNSWLSCPSCVHPTGGSARREGAGGRKREQGAAVQGKELASGDSCGRPGDILPPPLPPCWLG